METLVRDIAGVREGIRLQWADLNQLNLSLEERIDLLDRVEDLINDLAELRNRLVMERED